jgi:hypothetical protein
MMKESMGEQPKHLLDGTQLEAQADGAATVEVAAALTAALPEAKRKEVANNPLLLKLKGQHADADTSVDNSKASVTDRAKSLDFTHARSKRPGEVTAVAAEFVGAMQEQERAQVMAANPVLAEAIRKHETDKKAAGARGKTKDPNAEATLAA